MNPDTYWGTAVGLVREWETTTGIALGQDETSGDVGALCGSCFHLLHSDMPGGGWICSDDTCKRLYPSVGMVGSSIYRGYQLGGTPHYPPSFEDWVSSWTGVEPDRLTITIDFE